jgi:hypothetical protein
MEFSLTPNCRAFLRNANLPTGRYGPKSIDSPEPVIVTDILEYVHVAPDLVPTT